MESQSQRRETRRQEIGDRIAAIRERIGELQLAQRDNRHPVSSGELLAEAQHHAAISEATAQQALAASIEALVHAAQAHERAAIQHEQTAASGGGDKEQRRRRRPSAGQPRRQTGSEPEQPSRFFPAARW